MKTITCVIISILFFGFVIITVLALTQNSEKESNQKEQKNATLKIGEIGHVNSNKNSNDCNGVTVVGQTEEDLKTFNKLQVANNKKEYMRMIGYGNLFTRKNCSEITKIDEKIGKAKVRFVSDGVVGWVPYEYAVK